MEWTGRAEIEAARILQPLGRKANLAELVVFMIGVRNVRQPRLHGTPGCGNDASGRRRPFEPR